MSLSPGLDISASGAEKSLDHSTIARIHDRRAKAPSLRTHCTANSALGCRGRGPTRRLYRHPHPLLPPALVSVLVSRVPFIVLWGCKGRGPFSQLPMAHGTKVLTFNYILLSTVYEYMHDIPEHWHRTTKQYPKEMTTFNDVNRSKCSSCMKFSWPLAEIMVPASPQQFVSSTNLRDVTNARRRITVSTCMT